MVCRTRGVQHRLSLNKISKTLVSFRFARTLRYLCRVCYVPGSALYHALRSISFWLLRTSEEKVPAVVLKALSFLAYMEYHLKDKSQRTNILSNHNLTWCFSHGLSIGFLGVIRMILAGIGNGYGKEEWSLTTLTLLNVKTTVSKGIHT